MFEITPFSWTCPYCHRPTTVTDSNCDRENRPVPLASADLDSFFYVSYQVIVCPNPDCHRHTLEIAVREGTIDDHMNNIPGDVRDTWRLIPWSSARQFPDYVPAAIRSDYTEACAIVALSPKGAATLARRCLQGMIRDFWDVKGATLKDEIDALADRIDPLTWQAIDSVRSVGNIGAHMEKDINLIIEVDPDEATLLIWLIERLVADWYEARHEREERLKEIVKLGDDKKAVRDANSEAPSD